MNSKYFENMNNDEMKLLIQNQINKTNKTLASWRLVGIKYDEILGDDNEYLGKLLKKSTALYRFNGICAIVFSPILVIFSMLKYFDVINSGNMNKAGLLILFCVGFFLNTYRSYRLKVNIENKLFLLNLKNKLN